MRVPCVRVLPDNVFQKLQRATAACRAAEETASVLRKQLAQSEADRALSLAQKQQAQARYGYRVGAEGGRDWKGRGEGWGGLKKHQCVRFHHTTVFGRMCRLA